jgi:hypothetical protein
LPPGEACLQRVVFFLEARLEAQNNKFMSPNNSSIPILKEKDKKRKK